MFYATLYIEHFRGSIRLTKHGLGEKAGIGTGRHKWGCLWWVVRVGPPSAPPPRAMDDQDVGCSGAKAPECSTWLVGARDGRLDGIRCGVVFG